MFEVAKIQNGLYGLVGIRQPFNPNLPALSVDNTNSKSGLFVDEIPPFKLELLKETQDYEDISDTDFNTLLEQQQKTAIANLMYKVFDKGGYIDRNYLYTQTNIRQNIENTIESGSVFGYEIEISDRKNVAFKITNCRCEFSFDVATMNATIYLMNTNVQTPLYSKQIALTKNNELIALNWVVDSTMNDYKGGYYLVVKANNPTQRLQPFKRDYDDSNEMNNISEIEAEKVVFNSFSITDFVANENVNVKYVSENVGLNPDITVYEDYTDLILQNSFLFARALQLEYAIHLLMQIATSTRSNRNERMGKDIVSMIMINVNGTTNNTDVNVKGYKSNLYYEIKNIKSEIERLKQNYFTSQLTVDTVC